MLISSKLQQLSGTWKATNHLWLTPDTPPRESLSSANLSIAAQGKFFQLSYTWADDGKPQDGVLLAGPDPAGQYRAVWIDSWHLQNIIMHLVGLPSDDGGFSVTGRYSSPPGPDWGWRITIAPQKESFTLRMYNITPDGEEALAVKAIYTRI